MTADVVAPPSTRWRTNVDRATSDCYIVIAPPADAQELRILLPCVSPECGRIISAVIELVAALNESADIHTPH